MTPITRGSDAGFTFTKTDNGIIFPSKYTKQDDIITREGGIEVQLGIDTYIVGEGELITNIDKTDSTLTKLCILTSLALSTENEKETFNVVTGLPLSVFKEQREDLEKMLRKLKSTEITVNGITKEIKINEVEIFPQCFAGFYSLGALEDGEYLNIDWGGKTVDISTFEVVNGKRNMIDYSTILEGTIELYSKLTDYVSGKYGIKKVLEKGEKYVKDGYVIVDGEKVDITEKINELKQNQVKALLKELHANYDPKSKFINLFGGGGEMYYQDIKKNLKATKLIEQSQFANAIGYKKVGEAIWGNQLT